MIIINCGMPKSATTLVGMYEMDLITAAFPNNAIEYSKKNNKNWVPEFTSEAVSSILQMHECYGSFVVKTHSHLRDEMKELVKSGIAKITFCYRDPRDTILSAIDHGERSRKGLDRTGALKEITSVRRGIKFAKWSIGLFDSFSKFDDKLLIKYETFMDNRSACLRMIARHLGLELDNDTLETIYSKHEMLRESSWNFNKGASYRWKDEMSLDDLELCEKELGEGIKKMGYDLYSK